MYEYNRYGCVFNINIYIFLFVEPFDHRSSEAEKPVPITSIIPTNNHASSVSSFGATVQVSTTHQSNYNNKPAGTPMKLEHKSTSHLSQTLDNSQHYTPQHNSPSNTEKNDRKAEMEKRREERRQVIYFTRLPTNINTYTYIYMCV